MNFQLEITDFPTRIQKVIYCEAREIIPLSFSLPLVSNSSLQESCKEYYNFYLEFLSDIYDNPEEYYLPVGEYEKFLNGHTINYMKQKEPKKANMQVSKVMNSLMRYTLFLCLLGYYGELIDSKLYIHEEDLKAIKKSCVTSASSIPLEKRFTALERMGIIKNGDEITSTKYPKMFLAMKELAMKTKGKSSGFNFYLFQKVDYRNIEKNYKPTYVDYYLPLFADRKKLAYEIHEYLLQKKCKVTISTFLKVDYKYRGSQVVCVESEKNTLRIRIIETYNYNDPSLIESKVLQESKEFQKYFMRNIWRCAACSTTHLGMFIDILGMKNRVCGGGLIGMEITNPSENELEYIKKLIDFRCQIIDELEKSK